jgi:hypothetical protein
VCPLFQVTSQVFVVFCCFLSCLCIFFRCEKLLRAPP